MAGICLYNTLQQDSENLIKIQGCIHFRLAIVVHLQLRVKQTAPLVNNTIEM